MPNNFLFRNTWDAVGMQWKLEVFSKWTYDVVTVNAETLKGGTDIIIQRS
jgi:hypothetical protein